MPALAVVFHLFFALHFNWRCTRDLESFLSRTIFFPFAAQTRSQVSETCAPRLHQIESYAIFRQHESGEVSIRRTRDMQFMMEDFISTFQIKLWAQMQHTHKYNFDTSFLYVHERIVRKRMRTKSKNNIILSSAQMTKQLPSLMRDLCFIWCGPIISCDQMIWCSRTQTVRINDKWQHRRQWPTCINFTVNSVHSACASECRSRDSYQWGKCAQISIVSCVNISRRDYLLNSFVIHCSHFCRTPFLTTPQFSLCLLPHVNLHTDTHTHAANKMPYRRLPHNRFSNAFSTYNLLRANYNFIKTSRVFGTRRYFAFYCFDT